MAFTQLDKTKLDFTGWYIDGKLTAKIITTSSAEGGLSTPELVPLGGVQFGFGIRGGVTNSKTLDTVIDFAVSPVATDVSICRGRVHDVRSVGDLGIYSWLYAFTQTASGQPVMAATNLTYTLDFGVALRGSAGVDVVIAPIKVDAKVAASRDDIQQLSLKLSPGEAARGAAKVKLRSATDGGMATTPNGGIIKIFRTPFASVLFNDATIKDTEALRRPPAESR